MANNRTIAVAEEQYQLGRSFLEQEEYEKAHTAFTKAIILDASHANAYLSRGNTNVILENIDQAISDFEAAIAVNPANVEIAAKANYNLGVAYFDEERYDTSLTHFSRAIALTPNDHAAYYSRGTAFMRNHNAHAAIVDFKKAISLKPDYYRAYINLGIAYSYIDNPGEAIHCFNHALRVNPGANRAYYYRGLAQYENNNPRDAIDDIVLAIMHAPGIDDPDCNKELTLETITDLPNNLAIPLLLTCLDKDKPLGSIFWQKRGFMSPSLTRGTLKTVIDELDNRGVDTTQHKAMIQKESQSWLSFFTKKKEERPMMNAVCDDNMFKL